MIPAIALALSLMLADTPPAPDAGGGEPLPPGAPTDSYQLSAWCYGALDEYLGIYDRVKPDLRDMDHMFGTSVVEDEPYHSDMAAARVELKAIGDSVTDAEKASPRPISEQGAAAIQQGRSIWSVAEAKTHRELARAWMLWALPDRCASNAKELAQRSLLFGKALGYNNAPVPSVPEAAPRTAQPADTAPPSDTSAPTDTAPGANEAAPPPAADPNAQASPTTDTNVPASPPATDAGGAPEAPTPTVPDSSTGSDPAVPPYPTAPVPGDAPPGAPADQPPQATSPQP